MQAAPACSTAKKTTVAAIERSITGPAFIPGDTPFDSAKSHGHGRSRIHRAPPERPLTPELFQRIDV
jgi:hypothetical protein